MGGQGTATLPGGPAGEMSSQLRGSSFHGRGPKSFKGTDDLKSWVIQSWIACTLFCSGFETYADFHTERVGCYENLAVLEIVLRIHCLMPAGCSFWGSFMESESEGRSVVSDSLRPPWTIQSMEFSRPKYWSVWPFPSPGDLPNPGIFPTQVSHIAGRFFTS